MITILPAVAKVNEDQNTRRS